MGRFANPDPRHQPHGFRAVWRWGVTDRLLGRRQRAAPGPPAPRIDPDLSLIHERSPSPRLTWIGHASFLASMEGRAFLIDPVLARRVGWIYPRYGAPGLRTEDLPDLAAVLVSHNHYDHLDGATLRSIPKETPVIVPRGLGRWFGRWNRRPVVELEWWESTEVDGLKVSLVPARHWSRRWIFDTNRTLWGGFVVECNDQSIYYAGDTAWFDGFAEIGRRFPGLLAALLPVGGYSPAWFMEHNHLNPIQAARAFEETHARHFVPMHWGTFQLTDESLTEPVEKLRSWWIKEGPRADRYLWLPAVGETLVLSQREKD